MKLGYSTKQLCDAIDGCAKTPHNMGDNDRGQRYDGLQLILRSADHIDRFIANAKNPPVSKSRSNDTTMDDGGYKLINPNQLRDIARTIFTFPNATLYAKSLRNRAKKRYLRDVLAKGVETLSQQSACDYQQVVSDL